jgi:hypothetical protein
MVAVTGSSMKRIPGPDENGLQNRDEFVTGVATVTSQLLASTRKKKGTTVMVVPARK